MKKLVVIWAAILMSLCSTAFAGIIINGSMGTPDLSTGHFMGKASSYQYQAADSDGRNDQGMASIQINDETTNTGVVVSFYKNDLAGGQAASALLGKDVLVAFDKETKKVRLFAAFENYYSGEKKPLVSTAKIQ